MPSKKESPKQLRTKQLEQIQEFAGKFKTQIKEMRNNEKTARLLDSVSLGLYDEIDKLCRKAPAEPLTDLALKQTNDVIKEAKQLLIDDPYIQKLSEFVPAGDNPQYRDAVVVLRQVREALKRSYEYFNSVSKQASKHLEEARGIQLALELFLEDQQDVYYSNVKDYDVKVPTRWFIQYRGEREAKFDFEKLDETDLTEYFELVD